MVDPVTNWTLYDVRLHGKEWPRREAALKKWARPVRPEDYPSLNARVWQDARVLANVSSVKDRWNETKVVFYNRVPKSGEKTNLLYVRWGAPGQCCQMV